MREKQKDSIHMNTFYTAIISNVRKSEQKKNTEIFYLYLSRLPAISQE